MAVEIGALRAALSASSVAFERDMGKARDAVRRSASGMKSSMDGAGKSFGDVISKVTKLGAAAAAAAVGGLAVFVKKQIDAADVMGEMAQKTGTTSEYLSAMGFVAEQSGTSLDSVAKATKKLSQNMDDARSGTGKAKDAFSDLGIKVEDSNGILRKTEDVMLEIADKFANLQDGADKTALAIKLFGKSGADLIPMLNMGKEGIVELMEKAEKMGLVISTETALQAGELNDQLDAMKSQLVGLGRAIVVEFIPDLNEAVKTIRDAYDESGLLTASWVALAEAGHIAFGARAQREVDNWKQRLDELQKAKKEGAWHAGWTAIGKGAIDAGIEEAERELAKWTAIASQNQRAQTEASVAAREESDKATESKRKATAALRAQSEARERNTAAAKEEEKAEKKRLATETTRLENIKDFITALEAERDTLGMTADEMELYRLRMLGATEEQIAYAKSILDTVTAHELMVEQGTNKMAWLVDTTKDQFDELKSTIDGWGKSSAEAFAEFAMSGKQSFSDLINSMIRDMISMMAYQQVFGPLFSALGTWAGNMISPVPMEMRPDFVGPPSPFPPGRASGGPVSARGMYEVAERGPEILQMGNRQFLLMGNQSGQVVSAQRQSGEGGGSCNVKVNVINNTGPEAKVRQEVPRWDGQEWVVSVWLDAFERNVGGLRRAFGR